MSISPYLFFDGTCREAMTTYADVFGGSVEMVMTFGDAPPDDQIPGAAADHIMHMSILVSGGRIMGSDDMPGKYVTPAATNVMITLPDLADAHAAFERLAEGGDVKMPFSKTFWAEGFGVLVDKWGTPWMISVDDPEES